MVRTTRPQYTISEMDFELREDHVASTLDVVERHDFLLSVKRAEADAARAIIVRDGLQLWAKRLLPYLERDPHMTVAEALQLYRRAQVTEAPPHSS